MHEYGIIISYPAGKRKKNCGILRAFCLRARFGAARFSLWQQPEKKRGSGGTAFSEPFMLPSVIHEGERDNTLFRYGGDSAVAAMGIFTTFTQLLVMVVIGICQGMQPIVGFNFGARQFSRLRRAYWVSAGAASVICLTGTIVCNTIPELIARAFTTDAMLIEATANSLRITTAMFWTAGFQIVSTNFFQSLGFAGKSIFLSLTRQVIFIIPMLIILPPYFGLDGVWGAFPTADTMATFVTAVMAAVQFRQLRCMEAAR